MERNKLFNKLNIYIFFKKYKAYFFIFLFLFLVFLLSFIGLQFKFYGLKWHYIVTPIGLIQAFFGNNPQFVLWGEYLLSQKPIITTSFFQLFISIISSILSLYYLLSMRVKK